MLLVLENLHIIRDFLIIKELAKYIKGVKMLRLKQIILENLPVLKPTTSTKSEAQPPTGNQPKTGDENDSKSDHLGNVDLTPQRYDSDIPSQNKAYGVFKAAGVLDPDKHQKQLLKRRNNILAGNDDSI
jgi:hypothetical protein